MTADVGRLPASLPEDDELVAQVDESHAVSLTAQLELEGSTSIVPDLSARVIAMTRRCASTGDD